MARDDRGMAGRSAERGRQPDDHCRVEARRICRRQVFREKDRRNVRFRNPRFGSPDQLGEHAVTDIAEIGHALGHQAAEFGEHGHELFCGRGCRCGGGIAGRDELLGCTQPATIRCHGRIGGEHFGRRSARHRGPRLQSRRNSFGALAERLQLAVAVRRVDHGVVERRRDAWTRNDHRARHHAWHHRRSVQHPSRASDQR